MAKLIDATEAMQNVAGAGGSTGWWLTVPFKGFWTCLMGRPRDVRPLLRVETQKYLWAV